MARKRNSENDLVVSSGVAPAPVRRKTTAARPKHSPTTADETAASPVREPQMEAPLAPPVAEYAPSHEEIARLAYLYWEARGYQGGSPEEDWLRAENELRIQASAAV